MLERVRLGRTDNGVLKLLVILDVVKLYLGADVYGIVGKLVLADDLYILEHSLDLDDARLDLCLLLASLIVLAVLREVSERSRSLDSLSYLSASDSLKKTELVLQLLVALIGNLIDLCHVVLSFQT